MKIIFLQDDSPPESLGGAGIVAFNLAKALKDLGHEVFVISAVQDKSKEGTLEYDGLRVFRVYSAYHERWRAYLSLYNPATVGKVRGVLNEIRPDIVHAHNVHTHLSYHTLRLAKLSGAKVFLTAHDAMLFNYSKTEEGEIVSPRKLFNRFRLRYNPLRNIVIRHYLRYVDRIFAVSHALASALSQNGINVSEVIHNGIDVTNWEIDSVAVERFSDKNNLRGRKIILFGGRLSGPKGGEEAVRVLGKVAKGIPDVILLIIGRENEYARKMKVLAGDLGVEDKLVFTGWIEGDELRAAYASSGVVCVLSKYLDPFPTVVLEAMAATKPVVATKFGGSKEAVIDGSTGYVVDPNDTSEVSRRVVELLSHGGRAEAFGEKGRKRVVEEFSLRAQADELVKSYEE